MVTLSKHAKSTQTQIRTALLFFNEPFIYKLEDDCLVFKHVSLDYRGKTQQLTKYKQGYVGAIFEQLPIGNYKISEESNEDEIVIYL